MPEVLFDQLLTILTFRIGDGFNDGPSLAAAGVGTMFCARGTDVYRLEGMYSSWLKTLSHPEYFVQICLQSLALLLTATRSVARTAQE